MCSDCENAAFTSSGVYCLIYQEYIYDETVAAECEMFDEINRPYRPKTSVRGLKILVGENGDPQR